MSKNRDGAPGAEGRSHRHHDDGHDHHRADWPFADDRGHGGPRPGRRWPDDEGRGRRPSRGEYGGGRGRGRGGPGGPWGGRGFGGPRRSRGDVRLAILALLAIEPMHGYQMIQEIGERSGGRWEPSPGSVYPTLQAMEDEGLVTATQTEGKRVFELTAAGREQVESLGDKVKAPWDLGNDGAAAARALADQMRQLAGAFAQVLHTGSADQQARALSVMSDARRALYQILADGPEEATPADAAPADPAATQA